MSPEEYPYRRPPLTPLTASWMQTVVEDHSLLNKLLLQHGSPINLHYLKPFAKNYHAFKTVLDRHELLHTIFFARKANKCQGFARAAKRIGFGVDTASYRELKHCIDLGCDPDKLVCTAAVKGERLLRLALIHDVMIMLDNEDECRLLNKLAGKLRKSPRVGIRLSGFISKGKKLYSRFGFEIDNAADFIINQLGPDRDFCNLNFSGFHFHLDGYSIEQRGEALVQTIGLSDQLQKEGISTTFIDIGGGVLMNYLYDKKEWETFWDEMREAVRGERPPITFGNSGLGYEMIDGQLQGSPNVYPYYNETNKEQFLNEVLCHKDDNGQTAANLIRERDIEIRMEPGRALLDQCGMTVARIAHRKKDQRGNWLVGLEMNRSQLSSSSADFLLDPLFVPVNSAEVEKEPLPVYLTGAYCLEQDIILKRQIILPHLPQVGDVIAFPNTAGYMMHFYETESHLLEKTTNLVAGTDSFPIFLPDENIE